MQEEVPVLQFPKVRMRGFYTQFKQWPITPLSSNMYWQPDDIARFMINITQGVMDPYRSHIEFTVQTNPVLSPVGWLQMDSSAQSLIAQTVVSSNQVEVERITQYDSLAAYLTDIGFSEYVCEGRQSEGLGYNNIPTTVSQSCNITRTTPQLTSAPTSTLYDFIEMNTVNPLYAACFSGRGPTLDNTGNNWITPPATYTGQSLSLNNWVWYQAWNENTMYPVSTFVKSTGRSMTVRAQYMGALTNKDYPDANYSLLQGSPLIKNQTWTLANMQTQGFSPKNPYQIGFQERSSVIMEGVNGRTSLDFPVICGLFGYQKAYCSEYARGTKEATISATVPTVQMQNGVILPYRVPVSRRTFRLPLISNICGILIPPESFFLIPLKALNNLLLEITLSKFGMFTSGYCDVHQMDTVGMQYMQKRAWIYTNIQWNLHIYTFAQEQVVAQINASLTKSINITTCGYALSSQFQIPNGGVVRNSWPIGAQYDSLCQIICLFLSNQYQTKSFCRKQFRLSNNVTSMQVKVNTQFYPTQPIIGNGGSPLDVNSTGDNWPYYEMILLSTNHLFQTNYPNPRINQKNFAINKRIYDVHATGTAYDVNMYNNPNYTWTDKSMNLDTAMGMPAFHENRYVGKAAYIFTWEPYGHSKTYITGINTVGTRNLQIAFNVSPTQQFPTDQTLLIFARFNCIVRYSNSGVMVFGK